MTTKVADVRVVKVITDVIVLGWAGQIAEEVSAIKTEISRYVANAVAEGFSPRDMLHDILDKYSVFFSPVGEVDRIDHQDRTEMTFFLRASRSC
ncbi:hypothetical protein ACVIGB_000075 [Bradyrhizobium sp. USDA 4341]